MSKQQKSRKKRKLKRLALCSTGKKSYKDKISALLELAVLKKKDIVYNSDDRSLTVKRAYKCDKCKYWHLTSKA